MEFMSQIFSSQHNPREFSLSSGEVLSTNLRLGYGMTTSPPDDVLITVSYSALIRENITKVIL